MTGALLSRIVVGHVIYLGILQIKKREHIKAIKMPKQIRELIEDMKEYMDTSTTLAESSKKKYLKVVRLFLLRKGTKISIPIINKFISDSNRNKNCYNYKAAFQYFLISVGLKHWYPDLVKVKKKPRSKVFKFIPMKLADQLLKEIRPKFYALTFMQLHTGVRFQEIATMRAENIDFNLHPKLIYITIGTTKSRTKGSKERKIRLVRRYESFLRSIIGKPYGYIFLPREYEYYNEERLSKSLETIQRYINESLNNVGSRHGIDRLSTHYLRHIFADHFMANSGTAEQLQRIMGHSRMETTLSYVSIGNKLADETLLRMEEEGYEA